MGCTCPEGLELVTAVGTLAAMIAECLTEEETELAAAIFTQLGDTLVTISVQRARCEKEEVQTV
ncbi:MAG: hypothetical protein LKJ80_07900 [Oscillibacter sp.]|jgi:hypothetical protein|nr:hypothetical protein [Oscillibacter sp.]